jgi:hypothetical protein
MAPIPKDPQPTIDRIDELARRILAGDILLPKFQRDFVWGEDQVLMLWDSVARGYPIGSILLWQSRMELRSQNCIADLQIKLPKPDYPVNYLLDGQQRLSSICGAMYWRGGDPKSPWNIAYDLRTDAFIHLDALDDPPLHQIRISKLSDPASYFKHVSSLDTLTTPDKDELKDRADSFFRRFKDYKIASVTLGDMPIEAVAPIFERINSQGTPLTIVDLMRAATWSPDFDLIEEIDGILQDLEEKGFEEIDKKVVLRNLNAATGGGFSADSISNQLRKHTAEVLKRGVQTTKEAYKRTVDYLSTQVHLPNAGVLPYINQIVVLAEMFRRIPSPTAKQYAAIERWFWRTSYSGYFSGWNTGMMSSDLRAVEAFADGDEDLPIVIAKPSAAIWKERPFRANNAHSKLLAILLGYQTPIDLLTGQKVDVAKALAWTNAKEFHHFFPQEYLCKKGVSHSRINSLANIIMLSSASNKMISARAPSDYLKDVEVAAGSNLVQWLQSNLIPEDAYRAALADDFDAFVEARAGRLHEEVVCRAGW